MYFSRLSLNPQATSSQLSQLLHSDSYREHQRLWKLFDGDPDARRDFLYRRMMEHGQLKYYLVSERRPNDESGTWLIDAPKRYEPQLSVGQRLFFMLKVNPVVTVKSESGKQKRHDVVMYRKNQLGFQNLPEHERPPLQQVIQESCSDWLSDRSGKNGFSFSPSEISIEGYRRHRSFVGRKSRDIRYSTVDIHGLLTVTDPQPFRQLLCAGIGKSKAFGCGLLLIRNAG